MKLAKRVLGPAHPLRLAIRPRSDHPFDSASESPRLRTGLMPLAVSEAVHSFIDPGAMQGSSLWTVFPVIAPDLLGQLLRDPRKTIDQTLRSKAQNRPSQNDSAA